jgi:uncharacterized protein YfaS (alpha-2-macroglobulin family)
MRGRKLWLLVILGIACGAPRTPSKTAPADQVGTPVSEAPRVVPGEQPGLTLVLREAPDTGPKKPATVRTLEGTPLSAKEASALWQGVPKLAGEKDDALTFNKRPGSAPPPTATVMVEQAFPPPPSASGKGDKPEKKALEIVRVAPQGDAEVVRELSITFNQPMVALTSHAQSVAGKLPVELSPLPKGHFRWIGTSTLLFTAEPRFPFATDYTLKVPAGTKATSGAALGKEATFKFRTPELALVDRSPEGQGVTTSRTPLVYLAFNQRIVAQTLLAALKLEAKGQRVELRLARDEEIAKDPNLESRIESLRADGNEARAIVVTPVSALPGDTRITVTLPAGSGGGEGPRATTKPVAIDFKTHGALALAGVRCPERCDPTSSVEVKFSNPLDNERFDPAWIRSEPAAELQVYPGGDALYVQGDFKPRTEYRLFAAASVVDTFGQQLGKEQSGTFTTGDARPELSVPSPFVLLDPRAPARTLDVESINIDELQVEVRSVTPDDYLAFARARQAYGRQRADHKLPGKVVHSQKVSLRDKKNQRVTTPIDLSKALASGRGHAVVTITPRPQQGPEFHFEPTITWVQSTELGIEAFWDRSELVVWSTSLSDGSAQSGIEVTLEPDGLKAQSGADGVARFKLPEKGAERVRVLVAKKGSDVAILPEYPWGADFAGNWQRQQPGSGLRAHIFDDRGLYRPGETVHVKGWLRMAEGEAGAPKLPRGIGTLDYEVRSASSETFAKGTAKLNDLGGFDLSFALPKTVHLGGASLVLKARTANQAEPAELWHGFQIEEYRRPEYEVSIEKAAATHFVGAPIRLEAHARYHAGGGLAEAKTTWSVSSSETNFTPPGRDAFVFGEERWFWDTMRDFRGGGFHPHRPTKTETLIGRTDGRGVHAIEVVPARAEPAYPHSLEVNVSVEDLSRQNFATNESLIVHPSDVYVGLRTTRSFSTVDEGVTVESIVTDLDGKAVSGRPVTITLLEQGSKFEKGQYVTTETAVDRCTFSSTDDVYRCQLRAKQGGSYRIAARVLDARERPNESKLRHWVSGDSPRDMLTAERGQVEVIADKKSYEPGETAQIMLRVPFAPSEALVRVMRDGIVELRHLKLSGLTQTFDLKLGEAHAPNLHVLVEAVGRSKLQSGQDLPAHASGQLDVAISLDARRLRVEAKPAASRLEPGTKTSVSVTVRDAKGNAAKNADVALIVVDEAILQMLAREEQDPLATMHPKVGVWDGKLSGRDYIVVPRKRDRPGAGGDEVQEESASGRRNKAGMGMAMDTAAQAAPPMAPMAARAAANGSAGGGAGRQVVQIRKLFEPLALFAGSLRTDGQGSAQASFTLPDTLTRYRVLAVAASGEVMFGKGESAITVQKQLMLRPAVARFLNLGDQLSLPVLVQNESDEPRTVDVGVRATNLELTGAKEKRITVPAHDRVEVRFTGKSRRPGTARLQFVARADKLSDGSELALPAYTPATDEAFATYGSVEKDGAIAQTLSVPRDVAPEFGGLEVSLSSTQVSALTDAVLSVLDTPYEFAEQSASRILAILATRDVLAAFAVEGLPSREALDGVLAREVARLASLQRGDGAFGFYDGSREPDPFVSVHVSHALARAQKANIQVPGQLVANLRQFVGNVQGYLRDEQYGPESRSTVLAYAAYTEHLWGSPNAQLAESALDALKGKLVPADTLGWVLPVFRATQRTARVQEIQRLLNNRVSETAAGAEITDQASDGRHVTLSSTKRGNAVVLEALLASDSMAELTPKLARNLLAQRIKGKWEGSQENVFALIALKAYFDAYERDVPRFAARAFVDATLAAEKRFDGRSTTQANTLVPMAWLAQNKPTKLTLDKRGQGRLYYRLGLDYAPSNYLLPAADHGFVVERSYEPVDAPDDVRLDVEGTVRIRAGARVRVNVTMVVPARRHHVALVDPLPAGLEAINPALAVSERLPDEGGMDGPIRPMGRRAAKLTWLGPWFEHQNLRDERAEAHSSQVEAGVYTYTYYARATTPGRYIAPPPKAEELYAPETFGRGESARVIVE